MKIEKGYGMSGNQTSLLAKLLATENITVQQTPGIKTAMFDLKGRVLMLPLWQGISDDLQDLLIVHETGHALDTPDADTYKKAYEGITARIFPNEKVSDQLKKTVQGFLNCCLLYTSPSPRDGLLSRMPSSA